MLAGNNPAIRVKPELSALTCCCIPAGISGSIFAVASRMETSMASGKGSPRVAERDSGSDERFAKPGPVLGLFTIEAGRLQHLGFAAAGPVLAHSVGSITGGIFIEIGRVFLAAAHFNPPNRLPARLAAGRACGPLLI